MEGTGPISVVDTATGGSALLASSSDSDTKLKVGLSVGIVGGAVVLAVAAGLTYWWAKIGTAAGAAATGTAVA
jgi:hypothetical protein